jgi:hypothetical protein
MVQKSDWGLCGEYALAPVVYVHEGIVYPQRDFDFDMLLCKYVTTKHQLPRCDHKCLVTCTLMYAHATAMTVAALVLRSNVCMYVCAAYS